jgi:hypothetical protein
MYPEPDESALLALDVPRYFKLGLIKGTLYRLAGMFLYRREKRYARRLLQIMESTLPLSNFQRGNLLGMIDAWDISGDISPLMHAMLQIIVQDEKYWELNEKE